MPRPPEDPVLRSSRREAIVVLLMWLGALAYTVTYCYLFGYNRSFESLKFVWGFPDWVFWGIIAPWSVCLVLSYLFATFFMRDEDLGEDPEEETNAGGTGEVTDA
ncbi:MAG TPA: DUF997 family protein [Gemmataceae bacterium]|nr:DUF997 family protein [Gemmataceae bacterium]